MAEAPEEKAKRFVLEWKKAVTDARRYVESVPVVDYSALLKGDLAHRDRYRRCPVCDGKQTVRRPDGFDQDCPRCKGEGEVPG